MAKGVHNKTHKHNMSVKRKVMEESNLLIINHLLEVFNPRLRATSERLFKRTYGCGDDSLITRKPNAFRYPNNPEAEYPKEEKPVYIDKRSRYLPTEYLIRSTGEKYKNKIKRENEEAMKRIIEESEGKQNENQPIDIDDMDGIIDNVEQIDFEEKANQQKKKKEREYGMEIDDEVNTKNTRRSNKRKIRRGKKHSKSYYMMHY